MQLPQGLVSTFRSFNNRPSASLRCALLGLCALILGGCSGGDGAAQQKLTVTGSSTVAPIMEEIARTFEGQHPELRIEVQTGGSSRGIADARSGLADIGMASRELKDSETGLEPHLIAVDGIAIITHSSNPIVNLTRQQIVAIYTGKLKNWSDLGGADAEIVVVNKAEGRGTLEVFLSYAGLDSADVRADLIVGENQQAIKTVVGNPNAIAYVSIGAAEYEARNGAALRLNSIDGIEANSANVASGTYPISRPLLLLTGNALPAATREFIEYAQSEAVHEVILKHFYVPGKS